MTRQKSGPSNPTEFTGACKPGEACDESEYANDDMRNGRWPAHEMNVPDASNDDFDLTPPAQSLVLAKPRRSTWETYAWAHDALDRFETHPDPKIRRVVDVIRELVGKGYPLKSYAGLVCVEDLVSAAKIHARDAAPGKLLREVIDTIGQIFVSFPHHLEHGTQFSDPVAALYAVRVWGSPIGRFRNGISLTWFCALTGVAKSAAKQNKRFAERHRQWIADGTLRLASESYASIKRDKGLAAGDVERIKTVLSSFDIAGGKLPESAHRRGALDYEYLADLGGIDPKALSRPNIKRHLQDIRKRRGVALPGFDIGSGLCAHLLIEGMTKERKIAFANGNKKPEERCSGLRSAFMHLLEQNDLTTEDPAASIFGDVRYAAARSRASLTFAHAGTRRNFVIRCDRWKKLYDAYEGTADGRVTFAARLSSLLQTRGLSHEDAGEAAECSYGTIRNWCRGGKVSVAKIPAVARLETFLEVPEGYLYSMVRKDWQSGGEKDVNPHWYTIPYRFRRLLPSEIRFQSDVDNDAAAEKVSPLVHRGTEFAEINFASRSDEYRLPKVEFPVEYLNERAALVDYKTRAVPAPLLRARDARWKERSTIFEKERELDRFMRFALAPCSHGKNSGLGLPNESVTLAILTSPQFLLRYFAWEATRLADVQLKDRKRGEVATSRMRHTCWTVLSLTHPKTGYLTQQPIFADKLRSIEAASEQPKLRSKIFNTPTIDKAATAETYILSPAELDHARTDWKDFVAVAHTTARQILEHIDEDTTVVRDAMANAEGLLHGDTPAADYLMALIDAENAIRAARTGLFLATDLRNLTMCHLSLWTAFRPKNLYSLIYTGDDTGEIWKEDGSWQIKVSYRKFKNWRSTMLFGPQGHKQDYRGTISEKGLVELLDDWFFVQRPFLAAPDCDLAFMTRHGEIFQASSWYDACRQFGAKYIVWNPVTREGLKGVVSINPYIHRAIRATDILLNSHSTDKVLEAAFALQTSEDMIKAHYGLLIPEKALTDSRQTYASAWREARERSA